MSHPPDPSAFLSRWQLEEKAELNEHVKVLPFQREDREVAADTLCDAAGWGTVTHSGKRADRLQEVKRPVISRELCNHRTRHDRTITEKMMCTDSRKKDTCKVGTLGGDDPIGGAGERSGRMLGRGEGVGWDGVSFLHLVRRGVPA